MRTSASMVNDALRFMGIPAEARDGEMVERVRRTFAALEQFITPRTIWGCFPAAVEERTFVLAGEIRIESADLARIMARSRECWVLAVTLGSETDRRILLAQKRDMLEGMALDACASVRVDALCEEVEGMILRKLRQGEFPTMRFSPGYGDAPLSASEDIIGLLDATRRIGLAMTRSYMMTPVKSITALIGISDRREDRGRSCDQCTLGAACPYRKRGERCGT